MSEKKLSVSFRLEDGLLDHNNRKVIAKNVDPARIPDDIFYRQIDLREFYGQLFDEALAEYNSTKRPYLRIGNYYDHIENGRQEKLFNEVVVQFGDRFTCGIFSKDKGNWDLAKELLDEYMRGFEERNPNMKVFNSVLHADEDTPHLHIDFVPVCYNQKRGLSTRVSMRRALAEQGFTPSNKMQNELVAWENSEMEILTELLRSRGIERDVKNNTEEHLPVDEFKEKQAAKAEKEKLLHEVAVLRQIPVEAITAEDTVLIKNTNDLLCEENERLRRQLAASIKTRNAPFVEYDVYDPDKLQYLVALLKKKNIPFVEELFSVYVPETMLRTTEMYAEKFKPFPATIRDRVKLDIDRLVYAADSYDNLLERLKERGYEIKRGKYSSVKAPFAQRAVRVENLGEEYSRESIENRIKDAKDEMRKISESYENCYTPTERTFYSMQTKLIIEVSAFRIYPEKRNPDKPYSLGNDPRIDLWARQLETINEFHLHSRDGIQRKMEELEKYITKNARKNVDISKEQEDLYRVRELMKVYTLVVDGNFIDNLIKAEKERLEQQAYIDFELKREAEMEEKREEMQRQALQKQTLQKKEAAKAPAPVPVPKPEQEKPIQQTTQQPKKKIGHRR